MKIGVAYSEYRKDHGIELVTAELADRHAAWGHEVHYHCIVPPSAVTPGITFHTVPSLNIVKTSSLLTYALAAARQLRRGTYDITHTHGTVIGGDVITAYGCHRSAVRAQGGYGGFGTADRVRLLIERKNFTGHMYGRVIAVSRMTKRELMTEYGVPERDIVVIPLGTGAVDRRGEETRRRAARERFGIRDDQQALLFVGHEFWRKGLDVLIRALRLCENPRLLLLVCGDESPRRYQTLARDLGVEGQVRFIGYQPDVHFCYSAADIFVFPTRHDAFGLVVLEAMAHGLPVVVSRMAGVAEEAISHSTDGMILENPASAQELAGFIGILCGNDRLRRTMGDAARLKAQTFSWDSCAQRTLDLYKEVLEEKQGKLRKAGQ